MTVHKRKPAARLLVQYTATTRGCRGWWQIGVVVDDDHSGNGALELSAVHGCEHDFEGLERFVDGVIDERNCDRRALHHDYCAARRNVVGSRDRSSVACFVRDGDRLLRSTRELQWHDDFACALDNRHVSDGNTGEVVVDDCHAYSIWGRRGILRIR